MTTVTRFSVNSTTRLSIVSWKRAGGYTYAVALLRKVGKSWGVDHDSALEFVGETPRDAGFPATDYATKLVAQELGECPFRFFTQNQIGRKGA